MSEHDAAVHWERFAGEWTAWAREPGHDAYWSYRDAFRAFVPAPGTRTLEIGCGEGRVARDLGGLGHRVTATDISPAVVAAARDVGSAVDHLVADAASLLFTDGGLRQRGGLQRPDGRTGHAGRGRGGRAGARARRHADDLHRPPVR